MVTVALVVALSLVCPLPRHTRVTRQCPNCPTADLLGVHDGMMGADAKGGKQGPLLLDGHDHGVEE